MCDMGYGLTPTTLKMKVYEIMKTRWAPLNNVIPGVGWMRWWKLWHPEFIIHSSQGLDFARARGLSGENVDAFYNNLASLYDLHQCLPTRIWNYNKSGAQACKMLQPIPINQNATQSILKW